MTSFNLNGATRARTAASNAANLSGAVTNPAGTLQIDTTAPTVTSVTTSGPGIDGSGNGDLNAGHVVTLTVNLSEAVTVAGGTPTLSLNNGGTASYTGGTGTALSFSYTVGAGQDTGDLAVTSFNLNGATLQDAASNSANLSGAVTNPAGTLQIDTTAPTVTSVTTSGPGIDGSGNGDLNAGHVVTLTVNLSEAVTVAGGTPTLTLNNGGTATYIGGTGSSALTFSYTVGAGQNTADLAVTAFNLNGATLQGRRRQRCQSLRRGDQPGRHPADRHHGAGGDVGDNLRPRDRRQRQRRPQCRQRRHADRQPERGGDGGRRHADADAQRWRHRQLHRRLRQQRADLQLHGRRRPEHRRPGGDGGQPERGDACRTAASNAANLSGAVTNPAGTLQIDTTAPTVTSVATSGTGIDGSGNGDLNAGNVVTLTVNLSEAVTVAGGTPTLTLNDGGTASYTGGTGTSADLQLHGRRRSGHRRSGGDVVQPERGNAAGRGEQQRQSLRRGDQPGRHPADRHHGAGGDVGDNLRPRDRRQRQRRPRMPATSSP